MVDQPNGMRARVERLEEDARESRNRRDAIRREQDESRARLYDRIETGSQRITTLEVELRESRKAMGDDLAEIKQLLETQEQGTLAQKVAYISAAGAVIAALVIAVATVANAVSG